MKRKFRTWDEFMAQDVLNNPENIALYLEESLEEFQYDHDINALMVSVERVAKLQGSLSSLAEKTSISRQNLYKIFGHKVVPRFDTVLKIIEALGFSFAVVPKHTH